MSTPIGEALVVQATQALHEHSQSGGIKTAETMARAVLAAVEPQIREAERERLAQSIEALPTVTQRGSAGWLRKREALRVVGEEQPGIQVIDYAAESERTREHLRSKAAKKAP